MSEISPRPWKISIHGMYMLDANNQIIHDDTENLEHIIKCVNEYDSLVAKVRYLIHENEQDRLFFQSEKEKFLKIINLYPNLSS